MLTRHSRPCRVHAPLADMAATGSQPAVLDAGALERLRELDPNGQSRLLARVAQAFTSSVERLMPDLRRAWEAGDLEGTRTIGVYSHVDVDTRRRAEAAGFDLVVPRSRMAREGPALVARLSAGTGGVG